MSDNKDSMEISFTDIKQVKIILDGVELDCINFKIEGYYKWQEKSTKYIFTINTKGS